MKRLLLLHVMIFLSIFSMAGIEVSSFYFNEDDVETTGFSKCKLDELQQYMSSHHVQIIEINSFANTTGGKKENQKLAERRLKYILDYLGLQDENVNQTIYGSKKVELNFVPLNWHRVDVYYFLGEEIAPLVVEIEKDTAIVVQPIVEKDSLTETFEIVEDLPFVLPIAFNGGTTKIDQESHEFLEELYSALVQHTNFRVHIRGHVCCENNRRKSKKRAKVVCKYLKKRGVNSDRLSFDGYSNTMPIIFPEITEKDRAINRRVDVIFSQMEVGN